MTKLVISSSSARPAAATQLRLCFFRLRARTGLSSAKLPVFRASAASDGSQSRFLRERGGGGGARELRQSSLIRPPTQQLGWC